MDLAKKGKRIIKLAAGMLLRLLVILESNFGGGDMMTLAGVKCKVNSCKFWQQGEHCDASSIEVNIEGGGNSARSRDDTNCQTFTSKS